MRGSIRMNSAMNLTEDTADHDGQQYSTGSGRPLLFYCAAGGQTGVLEEYTLKQTEHQPRTLEEYTLKLANKSSKSDVAWRETAKNGRGGIL